LSGAVRQHGYGHDKAVTAISKLFTVHTRDIRRTYNK